MTNSNNKIDIDVRTLTPREKHPTIHATFDKLSPGESLTLINDHDPKPLYYEFSAEKPGQFNWEYLEQGPDIWKVLITKAK